MAKGRTKVRFKGGCLDGEFSDSVSARDVVKEVHQPTGGWFRKEGDQVQVMQGGRRDRNWLSYQIHIYKKAGKDKNGYFEYRYDRSEMVERCGATTKAGTQCMKSCYRDLTLCETHKE
ncbi:MAG: hypothetical protein ACR2PT_04875 [Endozoicomonas sp.]